MLSTFIDPFSSPTLLTQLPTDFKPSTKLFPRPELHLARSPRPNFLIYQLTILHMLTAALLIFISRVGETLIRKRHREAISSLDILARRPR